MLKTLLSPKSLLIVRCLLISVLGFSIVGCGGGLSQEDMKRMGIRRKKDEEEEPKIAQKKAPENPTAQAEANSLEPKPDTEKLAVDKKSRPKKSDKPLKSTSSNTDQIVSDTREKPAEPLPFVERCRISARNLERIGQALEAYLSERGKYPARAIYDTHGSGKVPLLSWRVELLPYLGYQELYDAFELSKPWNHPTNKALLAKIPAVYQSPERFDVKTNYLLVTGSTTLFPGPRTLNLRRAEDGIEHSALVVETNEELATSWTKPQEHKCNLKDPKKGLGALRQGSFYVIWGGGIPGAVSTQITDAQSKAMFTVDGGEPFSSYTVSAAFDEDFFAALTAEPVVSSSATQVASSSSPGTRRRTSTYSRGVTPGSDLASEYAKAARMTYALHEPGDALRWHYASLLLQSGGAAWDQDYRWIPGLQRPSPTVHFCVGVRGNDRGSGSAGRHPVRRRGTQHNSSAERAKIVSRISAVGTQLLEIIEEHAGNVVPEALTQQLEEETIPSRSRSRKRTASAIKPMPVSYLGMGSRGELTTEAIERAGDVLVLFETSSQNSGGTRWVSCDLIDLARGKKIVSLARTSWKNGADALAILERNDAYKRKRWQLKDALEDTLSFGDWPAELKPRHVEARVKKLGEIKSMNPLAALAEMSVYHNRQLIDTQHLLIGYRTLLGQDQGEALMLGSAKKKKRVLRNWLPADEFNAEEQLAQLRRASDDDDDD